MYMEGSHMWLNIANKWNLKCNRYPFIVNGWFERPYGPLFSNKNFHLSVCM